MRLPNVPHLADREPAGPAKHSDKTLVDDILNLARAMISDSTISAFMRGYKSTYDLRVCDDAKIVDAFCDNAPHLRWFRNKHPGNKSTELAYWSNKSLAFRVAARNVTRDDGASVGSQAARRNVAFWMQLGSIPFPTFHIALVKYLEALAANGLQKLPHEVASVDFESDAIDKLNSVFNAEVDNEYKSVEGKFYDIFFDAAFYSLAPLVWQSGINTADSNAVKHLILTGALQMRRENYDMEDEERFHVEIFNDIIM